MNRRTFLKAAVAGLAGVFVPVKAAGWVTGGPYARWAQQVVGGELDGVVCKMTAVPAQGWADLRLVNRA